MSLTVNKPIRASATTLDAVIPALSFVTFLASYVEKSADLLKSYCFNRSVLEIIVESVVAALIATAIYFGHTILMLSATLWCLAMLGVAAYRLATRSSSEEQTVADSLLVEDGPQGSEPCPTELSEPAM